MPQDTDLRKHVDERHLVLKRQRLSWDTQARDLARFIKPRRGQFWSQPNQGNRGQQKNQAILDPWAARSLATLAAGFMSNITSPARPWFRLTVPDKQVADLAPVKVWFDACADRMRMVFNAGNLYSALPQMYEQVGQFGTACVFMEFDREDVVRFYPMSWGEYWLGVSARGAVDTVYRRFMYSHRQIVQRWGENADEESTRKAKTNEADQEVPILHAVEPNAEYDASRWDWAGKPFRSVYWREDSAAGKYLARSGYTRWPVLTPRWDVVGNDAYSEGCGHDALPDVKSLQVFTKRLHNAVDKHVNPPMGAHISLKGSAMSVLPGATNYFATTDQKAAMWPLYQTQPGAIEHVRQQILDCRQTIDRAFYADVFLMISNMEGVQPRNQLEISTRRDEKMQMLGRVLENLHDEALQPLVSYTFDLMMDHRLIPPPPEELHGYPLEVELISILAQAQKAADLGSVERLWQFAGGLVAVKPDVMDKLNADETIDIYADKLGAPAAIVVPDDMVAKMRADRAQQTARAKSIEQAGQLADGAKTLSETDVGGGRNALQAVVGA